MGSRRYGERGDVRGYWIAVSFFDSTRSQDDVGRFFSLSRPAAVFDAGVSRYGGTWLVEIRHEEPNDSCEISNPASLFGERV